MNKTQKKILKSKLLRLLHIVCYILSAIFILVLIIGCVKSCNTKKVTPKQQNTSQLLLNNSYNTDNVYKYTLNYVDTSYNVSLEEQSNISGYSIDLSTEYDSDNLPNALTFDLVIAQGEFNYYVDFDNEIQNFDKITAWFGLFETGEESGDFSYRLNSIRVYYEDTSYPLMYFLGDYSYDYEYYFYGISYIVTGSNSLDSYTWLFNNNELFNFVFNRQFNYNAPLGTTIEGLYGSTSFDSIGENMRYKNFNTGYFISNGQLFNQIQYWCVQSGGNSVLGNDVNGGNSIISATAGNWIYSFMYYRNTQTGFEILVNYHDTQPYAVSGGNTSRYYARSSTWVNDSFRYVTFLEDLSDSLSISINSFNNNNQSYYGGSISGNTDVFILISDAFTSLLPFWSINILPNISIGVLFFLPLVVLLIITIVKMLRK